MIIKLSVLSVAFVALIVPVRGCSRIWGTRLSTLRTCVLKTAGVTRGAILTALEMIELSPTELRPGPVGVTCQAKDEIYK